MLILNPIQDTDPRDTYVKKSRKAKKFGKNRNIEIQQNPGLISCVSLNIKFEGSSWEIDFRNAKKSHDQPLCTYLMRYDAHLQSHPRYWPKGYLCKKNWNPMKRIQVVIRTPTADGGTDGRTDRRTDRQTGWIQYTPPQLRCAGYNK